MKTLVLLLAAAAVLAGCSTLTTRLRPSTDFTRLGPIYVESRLGDDHGLDQVIVKELQQMGYTASAGPLTMKPDGVNVVVFYQDRWEWDFKSYLIEFSLTVRDVRRDELLAKGSYYRATPVNKAPAEMIREVLTPIFKHS